MSKRSFGQKILLVILSLVVSIFILEAGLRVAGFLFLKWQDHENRQKVFKDNVIKIMCVGESTTALGGEFSYPSQLEDILNQYRLAATFHVINKGVPMTNTRVIRQHIGEWIDKYEPDIVVFMMGINDHNDVIPVDLRDLQQDSFIKRLRVYKLYQWFKKSMSQGADDVAAAMPKKLSYVKTLQAIQSKERIIEKLKIVDAQQDRAMAFQIEQELRSLSQWVEDNEDIYKILGILFLKYQWHEGLPEVMDYFLDRNHQHVWLHEYIIPRCRDPHLNTIIVGHLENRIEKSPTWQLHEFLGACYAKAGDAQKAEQEFQEALQIQRRFVDPITQQNYINILKQVKRQQTPFILVQYPMKEVQILKAMLQGDMDISQILFVDNQNSFEEAVDQDGYDSYFADRFGGNFGHCTPKGNRLLAENVAQAVLRLLGYNSGEDD